MSVPVAQLLCTRTVARCDDVGTCRDQRTRVSRIAHQHHHRDFYVLLPAECAHGAAIVGAASRCIASRAPAMRTMAMLRLLADEQSSNCTCHGEISTPLQSAYVRRSASVLLQRRPVCTRIYVAESVQQRASSSSSRSLAAGWANHTLEFGTEIHVW